jgi:cytochrome P450
MARDPRTYRNPDVFDPTRFLGENPEQDPRTFMFGFGRRICPGRYFADDTVFLMCATVLATLDISKATDAGGQDITPAFDLEGGALP